MGNILEMRGITKEFPGVKALNDVSLQVREGEIHALVGENGAGKSTLMKVLSGIYPHASYQGEIRYAGEPARFASIKDSESRGMLARALTEMEGQILGLGSRHPLGFWAAFKPQADSYNRMNG